MVISMKKLFYKRQSLSSYFPGEFLDENDKLKYRVVTKNNFKKFDADILYPDGRLLLNIKRRGVFVFIEYKITFSDNTYVVVTSTSTPTQRVFDLAYANEQIHFTGSITEKVFKAYSNKEVIAEIDDSKTELDAEYDITFYDKYEKLVLALIVAGIGERELSKL